jgi:hypothetical protein
MKTRALVVALVLVGCGELGEPERPGAGKTHPKLTEPDPDDTTPPGAPSLEALPARYGYESLPIHGFAEPGSTVFVEGGKAPVATDTDISGGFCVDVPLRPQATQILEVFAQDSAGLTSDPASVTITHDPSLMPPEPEEPPVVDLARGHAPLSDSTPKEGVLTALTDNNPTTSVLMPESTVWIDLGDVFDITSMEVVFPDSLGDGDDTFATEYVLLSTELDSPSMPPSHDDPDWSVLVWVYDGSGMAAGDGGSDYFVATSAAIPMRYFAVHLIENNKTDWFGSENIRVSELHVSGSVPGDEGQNPLEPTCANGAPVE